MSNEKTYEIEMADYGVRKDALIAELKRQRGDAWQADPRWWACIRESQAIARKHGRYDSRRSSYAHRIELATERAAAAWKVAANAVRLRPDEIDALVAKAKACDAKVVKLERLKKKNDERLARRAANKAAKEAAKEAAKTPGSTIVVSKTVGNGRHVVDLSEDAVASKLARFDARIASNTGSIKELHDRIEWLASNTGNSKDLHDRIDSLAKAIDALCSELGVVKP